MANVFIRGPYNYDVDAASLAVGLDCSVDEYGEMLPSMTQQQFKEECDINEIVRRFGLTGTLSEDFRPPVSGDFTDVVDYQSALNAVIEADEAFMSMPADIRERFANDPQRLMDFVADSNNREEAVKLGLVPRPPEKTRDVVQAVDELAGRLAPVPSAPKASS